MFIKKIDETNENKQLNNHIAITVDIHNIDSQAAIIDVLTDLVRQGKCMSVVIHSPAVAGRADKPVQMEAINRVCGLTET